jgi:hypothetical protein
VCGSASGVLSRTPGSESKQAGSPQKALRLASPLNQLPWDIAQDQFGAQGADFVGVISALLVRFAQEEFAVYYIDSNRDPYQVGGDGGVLPVRVCCKVEWWRRTGLGMRLEFHQLERRLEHLRVHRPQGRRKLLASLAVNGHQMPIIVVAAGQADRYLAID